MDLDSRKSESSQYQLGVCYVAAVDEDKDIKLHGYDTKLNIIKLFNHKPGNLGLAMAGALRIKSWLFSGLITTEQE